MKSILIREVPTELHLLLKRRAKTKGQSLQQYLLAELTALAQKPTIDEVLKRIESRSLAKVDMEAVVRDLDQERRKQHDCR